MVVFIKPNSALGDTLRAARGEPVHYEGEIVLLWESGAFSAVGFGLDLTLRALQTQLKAKGLPWERAKAFDGAALCSNFVALDTPLEKLGLELYVNNELRQAGSVDMMLYPPAQILRNLSAFLTLEDGDLVMTGTPAGVGEVRPGDHFVGRVLAAGEVLVEEHWTAL
jgi:2-keto-4-pentenoate hydratase/2-oxohepta-3-ene-1,7-dioic acid hydratase in catechol pathway